MTLGAGPQALKGGRRGGGIRNTLLLARAFLNLGRRFECPCCGWRSRGFLHSRAVLRQRGAGYCPRCNSKARHRRDWLFLDELLARTASVRVLHLAPAWCMARALRQRVGDGYIAGDLAGGETTTARMDACDIPLRDGAVDAAVAIHVLEHVRDDRAAMREIFRALKPAGWALVTVPLSDNAETLEDPGITDPDERRRLYGERTHLRLHGRDFAARLSEAGFEVEIHPATEISKEKRARHGITLDETVFLCRKGGEVS